MHRYSVIIRGRPALAAPLRIGERHLEVVDTEIRTDDSWISRSQYSDNSRETEWRQIRLHLYDTATLHSSKQLTAYRHSCGTCLRWCRLGLVAGSPPRDISVLSLSPHSNQAILMPSCRMGTSVGQDVYPRRSLELQRATEPATYRHLQRSALSERLSSPKNDVTTSSPTRTGLGTTTKTLSGLPLVLQSTSVSKGHDAAKTMRVLQASALPSPIVSAETQSTFRNVLDIIAETQVNSTTITLLPLADRPAVAASDGQQVRFKITTMLVIVLVMLLVTMTGLSALIVLKRRLRRPRNLLARRSQNQELGLVLDTESYTTDIKDRPVYDTNSTPAQASGRSNPQTAKQASIKTTRLSEMNDLQRHHMLRNNRTLSVVPSEFLYPHTKEENEDDFGTIGADDSVSQVMGRSAHSQRQELILKLPAQIR